MSIFNDDKKTDLIGETWIDLQNLIIPGGSQNDHWHPLQCRGKYAGDVRIEMTYYDTRQQDEAVIVKRKEAAERVQGKAAVSGPSSTGLSGPRSLEKVKRRPLPTNPAGAAPPPRPAVLEQTYPAPPQLQHPQPSRPAMSEHAHTMPAPAVTNPDALSYSNPESSNEAPPHNPPAPSMQSRETYDTPDTYRRERDNAAHAPAPTLPPAGTMRRNNQEVPYSHDNHQPQPQHETRAAATMRSHADYDQPQDYRSTSEPAFETNAHSRTLYDNPLQSHESYNPVVSPQYSANPMTFGHVSTFSPRTFGQADEPAPLEYARPSSSSGPRDDLRYQPRTMKALPAPYHPEYATMQPRVEDEEEDAPPPPPPVHRSRMTQPPSPVKLPTSQSTYPYAPYSTGHPRNPSPSLPTSSSMPASLVAGYESEEQDRGYEGRTSRKGSTSHIEDEMMIPQPLSASSSAMVPASMPAQASVPIPMPYEAPIYPLRTSPQPMDDRSSVGSRGGSVSPDTRMITRKSVSPQPPSSRGSSVPFSPDSYDSFNPRSSRTVTGKEPSPAYETLSQARDAAVRSEVEPIRDPDQPIIGDDGREIDPSDHLPTDTWAPEPERKNRKPEVIIRFKHSPRPVSRGNDTSRTAGPPRVGFRTTTEDRPSKKYTPTHIHTREPVDRTPPRVDRGGHESYGSYSHSRGYSTPASAERPRSSRGSVSPSPSTRSPLYDYNTGPPIPSKVPISHGSPAYPVAPSYASNGNPGMDALSRELQTIDIGSVACNPSRAVRKYAPPRPSATMGYAS